MFSLDGTLAGGGRRGDLRSEGDLGALLFSAASGLSSLSGGLDAIRAEAQSFYRKAGRSHRLNDVKDQLKALQDQIREIDVQAGAYENCGSMRKTGVNSMPAPAPKRSAGRSRGNGEAPARCDRALA